MRRRSPNVLLAAKQRDHVLSIFDSLEPASVIRTLEPHVLDKRAERLRYVFGQRIDSVTAVMDAPHDPHNGAAVVRSCDAFGVQRLHVVERIEDFLVSDTVSRGSERWVDVVGHPDAASAISKLQADGFEMIATHPEGDLLPEDLRHIPRVAMVLGNERDGIEAELRSACKRTVRIPMRGFAESLNLSVTAAILMQYATEGRPGDLSPAELERHYARGLILTVPRVAAVLEARGFVLPDLPMA